MCTSEEWVLLCLGGMLRIYLLSPPGPTCLRLIFAYWFFSKFNYPSFLSVSICKEYLPSLHRQFVYILKSEVRLLKVAYRWVLFLNPFCHSLSFGWRVVSIYVDRYTFNCHFFGKLLFWLFAAPLCSFLSLLSPFVAWEFIYWCT